MSWEVWRSLNPSSAPLITVDRRIIQNQPCSIYTASTKLNMLIAGDLAFVGFWYWEILSKRVIPSFPLIMSTGMPEGVCVWRPKVSFNNNTFNNDWIPGTLVALLLLWITTSRKWKVKNVFSIYFPCIPIKYIMNSVLIKLTGFNRKGIQSIRQQLMVVLSWVMTYTRLSLGWGLYSCASFPTYKQACWRLFHSIGVDWHVGLTARSCRLGEKLATDKLAAERLTAVADELATDKLAAEADMLAYELATDRLADWQAADSIAK